MSPALTCLFGQLQAFVCAGTVVAVFGILSASACRTENPDHCLHKAEDADAWCTIEHTGVPYCSPCEAEMNGCVAKPPTPEVCALVGSSSGSSASSTGN